MIRDKKQERRERISVKTLDRVFTKEIEEGLNCSPFESKAILDVVKEIYLPWLNSTHSMHPGQMMVMGVKIEEPPGKPIKDCKMGIAVITYDAQGEYQN